MPCLPLFGGGRSKDNVFDETALECYRSLARSALGPIVRHQVLAGIARICKLQQYKTKDQIYSADEGTSTVYLLDSGTVELYKMLDGVSVTSSSREDSEGSVSHTFNRRGTNTARSPSSSAGQGNIVLVSPKAAPTARPAKLSRISFRTLQPGHWFGQCAALEITKRQCSARALSECRVWTVEWKELTQLLEKLDCDDLPVKFMLGFMIARELRRASFFHGMKREEASLLATLFHPRHVPAGTVLFEEGELNPTVGPSMYFVSTGSLSMHQTDPTRGNMMIRRIETDQFFGEACALFRLPRIASVRSTTECWIAELPFAALATFLAQFPHISVDVTCAFNLQHIPTQHLLSNPVVMAGFAQFVAEESSIENLEFWMAVRRFRTLTTRNKTLVMTDARALYDKYVSSEAERQVNLPSNIQKTLQNAIEYECVTRLTFEEAESEVLRLMDSDTFARFKVSSFFETCLAGCRTEQPKKMMERGSMRPGSNSEADDHR